MYRPNRPAAARSTHRGSVVTRRRAILALAVAACAVLALLAAFAVELANTQAKSKHDVEARVHERGVLAAALVDSLFQTVEQQIPQDARIYGAAVVPARTLNRQRQNNLYVALLDLHTGGVLAASAGFTPQARADLARSAALALVRTGLPYALGNILPYGRTGVINLALALPTAHGERVLLTGIRPGALTTFLTADLRQIPGVKGAHNYVIDANDNVIASTNPAHPAGSRFTKPAQVQALSHSSGDRKGHYYDEVRMSNSSWRIVLAAPNGPLFASVTGLRKWIPWLIFAAFAAMAAVALVLGLGVVRAAEELRATNSRLANVNRQLTSTNDELSRSNEELQQFAYVASHDLQEPLRMIVAYTEKLTEHRSEHLDDRSRKWASYVIEGADRMQAMVEGILDFSRVRPDRTELEHTDTDLVIRRAVANLDATLRDTAANVSYDKLPEVEADPVQLLQLFQNLIANAVKFRSSEAPRVEISCVRANGNWRFAVSDNGIGIDKGDRERVFELFARLHSKDEYAGAGIGLALCKRIVETHGGRIWINPSAGPGTTVGFTLPVTPKRDRGAA